MDVGAHRKKAYQKAPTVEDELWKRAFWCVCVAHPDTEITDEICDRTLVVLDRQVSAHLGRSCLVQDEEYVSVNTRGLETLIL